jgi:hypothetical protein
MTKIIESQFGTQDMLSTGIILNLFLVLPGDVRDPSQVQDDKKRVAIFSLSCHSECAARRISSSK